MSKLPRDLTGLRIGKLTILGQADLRNGERRKWIAQCDCGGRSIVLRYNLASGATQSCGCGTVRHRMHGTPTYSSWVAMRQRCTNPKHHAFSRYGGAGIGMHPQWSDFAVFLADMGERPAGTSLDRVDGSLGYSPGNCRWATREEQAQNKTATRLDPTQRRQVAWMHRVRGYSSTWLADVYGVAPSLVTHYSRRYARGEL